MTSDQIWEDEEPVTNHGIDVPPWVDKDISPSTVAEICQGGCASGAYMPAVTYHEAAMTMAEHGDAVLDFLLDALGTLPRFGDTESWSGIACFYLSAAVELWASSAYDQLEADTPDDEDED